jgi:pseudouridine-5'-phosphate glycosidase
VRPGSDTLRGSGGSGVLRLADEVADALHSGRPVVALETTLVSHGFSQGRGLLAAQQAEQRVRAAGAVPCTVGIADGFVRAGLSADELDRFAHAGAAAHKAGARDIAACVVQRTLGATTVGGTLAICRLLGIRFMGTGGIGGVHRGFAETLDISGDLLQLARTPTMVVSSGAKAILDVSATAELLETLSVPVLGWRTDTLPLFYCGPGGPPVAARVDSVADTARVASLHWELTGSSGLLLGRAPDPELDIEPVVAEAVSQVHKAGVTGQAVTPTVLALVEELTDGRSVAVNQQLIADNAALAAEIAVAYTAFR